MNVERLIWFVHGIFFSNPIYFILFFCFFFPFWMCLICCYLRTKVSQKYRLSIFVTIIASFRFHLSLDFIIIFVSFELNVIVFGVYIVMVWRVTRQTRWTKRMVTHSTKYSRLQKERMRLFNDWSIISGICFAVNTVLVYWN